MGEGEALKASDGDRSTLKHNMHQSPGFRVWGCWKHHCAFPNEEHKSKKGWGEGGGLL
jgi:hypothetical protein